MDTRDLTALVLSTVPAALIWWQYSALAGLAWLLIGGIAIFAVNEGNLLGSSKLG
ncbi:hypothetical protein [Halosegnis marinus]|uniref:Phosphatidate cytidylyltransferase n=1 Tax=Halosegnis marinus TaxID=3034023 RepID=A0ABD5ZLS7_9EURY|nr:hypothetical protein [Halosegnis sp. DT85]